MDPLGWIDNMEDSMITNFLLAMLILKRLLSFVELLQKILPKHCSVRCQEADPYRLGV